MSKQKIVPYVWIFDVDGVITNVIYKKVVDQRLFDELTKRLEKGEPIAFVTGRATGWVQRNVLKDLNSRLKNPKFRSLIFISGEKGGVSLHFRNSKSILRIKKHLAIPKEIVREAKKIEKKYAESMFLDNSKKTTISFEMKKSFPYDRYKIFQKQLAVDLNQILENFNLTEKFRVDLSRIGTDLESKNAGKNLGARDVLSWLKSKGIKPALVTVFGDDKHDLDTAREVHRHGFLIKLVFVGERDQLKGLTLPFPVTFTKEPLEKGTLEYLSAH